MTRHRQPTRNDRLDALFACPLIHDIAHDLGRLGRRSRRHPIALHLAWGAMARLYGSANRLQSEVRQRPTWAAIVDRYNTGAATHPHGIELRAVGVPLITDTYRHLRDHLTHDDHFDELLDAFTRHSVTLARNVGLLDPNGPGSRTRPHPTRTIYGDGTIVKPLYRPTNSGRTDPDAEEHTRHDGQIWGNDLVTIATRGPEPHRRVILAVDRVDSPGTEAATAVEAIRHVHQHAGDGILAVVYDGAFRGVHHETLMTELGLIVINKVHPATRNGDTRTYRQIPLGHWTHPVGNAPAPTPSSHTPAPSTTAPSTTPAPSPSPRHWRGTRSDDTHVPAAVGGSASACASRAPRTPSSPGSAPTPNPATPATDDPTRCDSSTRTTPTSPASTGSATTPKPSTATTNAPSSPTAPPPSAGDDKSSTCSPGPS
jgi:hypothetical protein